MRGQFHTAQFQSGWVESIFRSSGGGAARKRRYRPVPPQYRVPDSRRTEISERGHRTRVRLARSSPAQLGGRMHPGLVSHHGAEKHTRGWLDHPIPPVQSRSSMVGRPRTGAAARSFL